MAILKIHTDGGCAGNQSDKNTGGWGAILEYGSARKELCGGELNTTNNRMEMTALIQALSALNRDNLQIMAFSDSSYLMDCFRKKWYVNWRKNGWVNSSKKPVENRDLWEKLLELIEGHGHTINFYRVKGHVNPEKVGPGTAEGHKLYVKFTEWNGAEFTYDDFLYATRMNNRADALVHEGMEKVLNEHAIQK